MIFFMQIILASESIYRKQMLAKLGISFSTQAAHIDERPRQNESGVALCERLAFEKAYAVHKQHPDALVIGCDQVALLGNGVILGKPETLADAFLMRKQQNGEWVNFHSGLCVIFARQGYRLGNDLFRVKFRMADDCTIWDYLNTENVLDAAAAIKCEGLGVTLMEGTEGNDYHTLLGLPLMDLVSLLASVDVLKGLKYSASVLRRYPKVPFATR